jgi:hypothetical protein
VRKNKILFDLVDPLRPLKAFGRMNFDRFMIREILLKVIMFCIDVATWKHMPMGAALQEYVAYTQDERENTMNNSICNSWSRNIRRKDIRNSGRAG